MWLHKHPGTRGFELGTNGSGLRLMIFHKMSPRTHHTICNKITAKGPVIIYSQGWGGGGGGEGFGAKKGEIWPILPLNVTSPK